MVLHECLGAIASSAAVCCYFSMAPVISPHPALFIANGYRPARGAIDEGISKGTIFVDAGVQIPQASAISLKQAALWKGAGVSWFSNDIASDENIILYLYIAQNACTSKVQHTSYSYLSRLKPKGLCSVIGLTHSVCLSQVNDDELQQERWPL